MNFLNKNQVLEILNQNSISHFTNHSKRIIEGSAFFLDIKDDSQAILYLKEAIKNGARLVFTAKKLQDPIFDQEPIFYVENIEDCILHACDFLYPLMPCNVIFVTGTNGKTSTVGYVRQILSMLGKKSASIGTLGIVTDSSIIIPEYFQVDLTTPDNLLMRQVLHHLINCGINYIAIEASSHGIVQGRLKGIHANAIGFTSFSDDHLDYHGGREEYLKAKCQIFYENADSNTKLVIKEELVELIPQDIKNSFNIITIGNKKAQVRANNEITVSKTRDIQQKVSVQDKNRSYTFTCQIFSQNQIYNVLIALYLVECLGFNKDDIISTLAKLKPPAGRVEMPMENQYILVDYAHNADSLKEVLIDLLKLRDTISQLCLSRLIVIFGCGGDRYQGKRSEMGEVANSYADIVIVTDDNPRSEDPKEIRKQIMNNCGKAIEIGDRQRAIEYAIYIKKAYDIILISGKGHEDYQINKGKKIIIPTDAQVVKTICLINK